MRFGSDYTTYRFDSFGRFSRFEMISPTKLANLPDMLPGLLDIVIVGGGITGLSAAFYLERAARAAGIRIRYTLVERDDRFGGKIQTDTIVHDNGAFVVEGGPDSFVAQKPWGVQLARDLGLEGQLMSTQPARHSTYVLLKGRPRPMPEGMMLIVPTRLLPFARSPILSLSGKLRMALDLVIPPRRDGADETLADFIRRRLGDEALSTLAEPLLAGIHSADPERQSILATFPRFRALEEQHGGLIRGMLAARPPTTDHRPPTSNHQEPQSSVVSRQSSVVGSSPFVTLRGGVGELVRALLERLSGRMIAGRGVAALGYDPTAASHPLRGRPYRVRLDDGESLDADAVIVTAPASAAADLVAPFQPELATALRTIRYVTTGTITLAYRRADLGQPLDGFGLVIPRGEGRRINALTMTSTKFADRAPDGYALVRAFFGGSRTPDVVELDDAALLALVRAELRDILGIAAAPLWSRIYRWPLANPQYDVGHLDRVDALEALLPPGLYLAGSAYRGVGIPDCVRAGQAAAEAALAQLRSAAVETCVF
jgi:protoporphyrinogen/coproporphyrinogen III oxidase